MLRRRRVRVAPPGSWQPAGLRAVRAHYTRIADASPGNTPEIRRCGSGIWLPERAAVPSRRGGARCECNQQPAGTDLGPSAQLRRSAARTAGRSLLWAAPRRCGRPRARP
jgi:hypothetical protein